MKSFCVVVTLIFISALPAYAGKWSTGTTAPATCTVGDSWTDTNGTADNRFYTCTSTNTWTLNSNQTAIDTKANKAGSVMSWSEWGDGASFTTGSPPVAYNGSLYKCIAPYTKVAGETPDTQTEYFAEVTGVGGGIAHATSDGNYYASRNGAWASLDGVFVATETDPSFSAWDKDYADLINTPAIPAALADMGDDATHRIVTDAEKSAWNAKLGALPTWLPSIAPTNGRQIMQATGGCSVETYDTQATCEANAGTWTTPVYVNTSILYGLINDAGSGTDDLLSASKIITMLSGKQDTLTSGTNIKTINSQDITGTGNITISGTFVFDTYPTYEDSPHDSGIAENGTKLAVYSTAASKWLTIGLTDTLDPTPSGGNVGNETANNGSSPWYTEPGTAYAIKVVGVPANSGTLDSITVGMKVGGDRTGNVALYTDVAGHPGVFVASSNGTAKTISNTSFSAITWTTGAASITSGAQYWIVFEGDYVYLDAVTDAATTSLEYVAKTDWSAWTGGTGLNYTVAAAYFTYH